MLPPLAADGSSVVQHNATVPVKFRVCDANGVPIGTPGVVSTFLLTQIVQGGVTTDVNLAPVSTTPYTAFRWDPTDRLWIFNLSTKNLSAGAIYVYRIDLADGSSIVFRFRLKLK